MRMTVCASQSALADGAGFTFVNGPHQTTVDYCLMDCSYAHLIKSCSTLFSEPLNLSENLPIIARVQLEVQPNICAPSPDAPRRNWQQGLRDGHGELYAEKVSSFISDVIVSDPPPTDIISLEDEINLVCQNLSNIANNIIPSNKEKKKKNAYFNDKDLKRKCAASKAAWKRWNFEGRPKSGSSFLKSEASQI